MGRPRKNIDKKQFQSLCAMFCTLQEIAGFFDCSEDTIERWCKRTYDSTFAEAFKQYSAQGKISLRRNQMKMAEKNVAMAIFLGKNYLGQKDTQDNEVAERTIDAMKAILGTVEVVSAAQRPQQNQADSSGTNKADA